MGRGIIGTIDEVGADVFANSTKKAGGDRKSKTSWPVEFRVGEIYTGAVSGANTFSFRGCTRCLDVYDVLEKLVGGGEPYHSGYSSAGSNPRTLVGQLVN
jgi:hypothetical protein